MTQEQMQQLEEEKYPHYNKATVLINGVNDGIISDYNRITNIERAAFLHGLQTGLEVDRWIPCTERMPTKEDADEFGEIDAWHIVGRCRVEVTLNTFFNGIIEYSHWKYIHPPKPTK